MLSLALLAALVLAADDAVPTAKEVGGVLVGGGVLGAAYGLMRLYRYVRTQIRQDNAEADAAQDAADVVQDAKSARRKREAAEEAWQVVDRQNKVITGFEAKLTELEQRFDAEIAECRRDRDAQIAECRRERDEAIRDRSYVEGRLEVIEAWAASKGMKLPPSRGKPGSAPHRTLPDPPAEEK